MRGVDAKSPATFSRDKSKDRDLQALFGLPRQGGEKPIQPSCLGPAFGKEATIEHADYWLLRVVSKTKCDQIEPNPLECLLEMAPEGLLVELAEAGQVRKVDPAAQRKHYLEQLSEKATLPRADLTVVNVSRLPEHGGHHRREKRLWKHGP